MKQIILFLALAILAVSCSVIGGNKGVSFSKKGSPVYMKNGVKAEKVLTEDSKAPVNYIALSKPINGPTAIKAKDLGSYDLESFQANISLDQNGSISYTFFNPTTNEYFSNVTKKSIVGIKIIKDSMSCKVANYKFTSQINGKREPMSVVFILDHSGSMGDDRANIVQIALDSAINYKHKDDEITLIKFDHETKKLITSTNKKDL